MFGLQTLRKLEWHLIHAGPQRDITIDTANGRLTFDSKDWLVGKHLYVKRSYETDQIKNSIDLLAKEGFLSDSRRNTVIEVGTNIGMIIGPLLKSGHFKHAVAFEPAPDSFRLLEHNMRQNGLQDCVYTYRYALSSAEEEVELELSRDNSGDHRVRSSRAPGFFREERRRTVRVPAITLDGFFEAHSEFSREAVGLIWLDIQGHEGRFFEGARRTLAHHIPVVTEVWPYAILRSGMSRSEFCQILSELFTHFYQLSPLAPGKQSVGEVDGLFDSFKAPRDMCQLVLVNTRT